MAIVLKKSHPKTKKPHQICDTTAAEIAMLIDEIGAMLPDAAAKHKQIKALQTQLQPYLDKMKALTTMISAIQGPAADDTFKLEGMAFAANIGKRCIVRTVTKPALAIKLLNKVEKGVGWRVITVPLGKLDLYLSPAEKNLVLTVDRGDRSVSIIKKVDLNV